MCNIRYFTPPPQRYPFIWSSPLPRLWNGLCLELACGLVGWFDSGLVPVVARVIIPLPALALWIGRGVPASDPFLRGTGPSAQVSKARDTIGWGGRGRDAERTAHNFGGFHCAERTAHNQTPPPLPLPMASRGACDYRVIIPPPPVWIGWGLRASVSGGGAKNAQCATIFAIRCASIT